MQFNSNLQPEVHIEPEVKEEIVSKKAKKNKKAKDVDSGLVNGKLSPIPVKQDKSKKAKNGKFLQNRRLVRKVSVYFILFFVI